MPSRGSRPWLMVAGALLALALPWCGPAAADDEGRRLVPDPYPRPSLPHLDGSRFRRDLSRVGPQFESIAVFEHMGAGGGASDNVMFDEISGEIRRGVETATRRAFRDYVFDAVSLEQKLDALRGRDGSFGGGAAGAAKHVEFGVGIHAFEPEVAMKYRLDRGQIKLTLGAGGELSVRFRAGEGLPADLGLAFDGEHACTFSFRLGF